MSERALTDYFAMYTDVWHLFRCFQVRIPVDDTFWQDLMQQARILSSKYDSDFYQELIITTVNEIERIKKVEIGL